MARLPATLRVGPRAHYGFENRFHHTPPSLRVMPVSTETFLMRSVFVRAALWLTFSTSPSRFSISLMLVSSTPRRQLSSLGWNIWPTTGFRGGRHHRHPFSSEKLSVADLDSLIADLERIAFGGDTAALEAARREAIRKADEEFGCVSWKTDTQADAVQMQNVS